ncbi:FAD-dependent oxidoreductase [Herbidospora sp. NBRC 101105]|uniref:FAD-binding oxidoreductase n=1 Tax=Herbidospora sp. NBRC 101105 TaxID=3032195 RepID=UPI0024A5434F|nr:FAD-dependent oxidoreductase [Herbidospora sp. NBRC 101105]GLX98116.1 oxidoreductase [Herbidospora sp. NBRC 101105]
MDFTGELHGRLVLPHDPDWHTARMAWQLAVDQQPAAVVFAASAQDVSATVLAARRAGLRVAPQGTGHNAAPLGELNRTVLLRTDLLGEIAIDPLTRIARVGAGARWLQVTDAAAKYGLMALAGSAADVGVVGYTLGGGVSWFARSHGLASNQVVAADVVLADGTLVRADADTHPDLFWALRGGGGVAGIVTALEFRLFPMTETQAGLLAWPIEQAPTVLSAWRRWVDDVPDQVTSLGRMLRLPPLPDLPEPLRGRSLVAIEAVCDLPAPQADALLAPLRALAPELDTFGTTAVADLHLLHMDPPYPVPAAGDGMLLSGLPSGALAAFLGMTGAGRDLPLLSVELRHLGGALRPGAVRGGAVDGLDAEFALFAAGITPDAASVVAVHAVLDELRTAMSPWEAATGYRNFAERSRGRFDAPETAARLRAVKTAYDPDDLIHANHPVPSAE